MTRTPPMDGWAFIAHPYHRPRLDCVGRTVYGAAAHARGSVLARVRVEARCRRRLARVLWTAPGRALVASWCRARRVACLLPLDGVSWQLRRLVNESSDRVEAVEAMDALALALHEEATCDER